MVLPPDAWLEVEIHVVSNERPRKDRPRVTSQRQDRHLCLIHVRNLLITAEDAARRTPGLATVRISTVILLCFIYLCDFYFIVFNFCEIGHFWRRNWKITDQPQVANCVTQCKGETIENTGSSTRPNFGSDCSQKTAWISTSSQASGGRTNP
jgi:hypothetical protein